MQRASSKTRALLISAVAIPLAGISSLSHAALSIDVRLPGGGKSSLLGHAESVTVEVYLVGGDINLTNGLGSVFVGVRSLNETENVSAAPAPWSTSRTPTDTTLNATDGANALNPAILDFNFSHGTNADSNGIGSPDTNDTDVDRLNLGGTQSAANGWVPSYGKVPELYLGSATFTAQIPPWYHPANVSVDLNAFYSNTSGVGGGAVVKTLTGSGTVTNSVGAANLITGSGNIGTPVHVDFLLTPPPKIQWSVGPGGSGDQWLDPANWYDRVNGVGRVPNATDNVYLGYLSYGMPAVAFPGPVTTDTIGIDFASPNTNNGPANQTVGSVTLYSSNSDLSIINSSATPGTLSLTNGITNASQQNRKLTIGGSGGPMVVALEQSGVIGGGSEIEITVPITGTGKSLTKTGSGLLILSGANTYSGATTVNGGKLLLANNLTDSSSISVIGGTLELATGAGSNRVIKSPAVSVTGTGKIDLKDNKLITQSSIGAWNGSNYTGVTKLIKDGRNGGAWNGVGIVTSMSDAAGSVGLTTLAVATAGDVGKTTHGDVSVLSGDTLVMYTYAGDANLSGNIDGDDYFRIDSNAGLVGGAVSYDKGDFDLNGSVDADDYFIIDRNYTRQGSAFASAPAALGTVSTVPEPAGVMIIAMTAGAGVLRRGRRANV